MPGAAVPPCRTRTALLPLATSFPVQTRAMRGDSSLRRRHVSRGASGSNGRPWALKPGRPGLKTQLCHLQTALLSKFHLSWPPPSVCKIQGTAYPTPRVVMRIRGGDPESAWPTREPQSPVNVPPLPVQGPQRLVRGNLKFKGIPRPHWRFGHSAILKSDESPDPRHSVPPKTTRKAPQPASLNTEPFLRRGGQVWPTSSTLTAKDSKVAS